MTVSNMTLVKIGAIGGVATITMGFLFKNKLNKNIKGTEYYKSALSTVRSHPAAVHLLGEPIKDLTIDVGNQRDNFTKGDQAQYKVPLKGSKQRGTLYFWAEKYVDDGWVVNRIELEIANYVDKRLLVKTVRKKLQNENITISKYSEKMATALLENEVKHMRCSLCNCFLSVPPILIISNDGKENLCGRCEKVTDLKEATRNLCFENLARFLNFPCIYNYCPENLQWGEVEEHERTCKFKSIQCPIYYQHNCTDVVEISQFENHMKKKHSTNMIYGNILDREIGTNSCTVSFMKIDNEEFIIYIFQDRIFVGSLGPIKKYTKYSVKITADQFKYISLSYHNQEIVEYNERKHCYKCKRGQCNIDYHLLSWNYVNGFDDDSLMIHKNAIKEFLHESPTLLITVKLITEDFDEADDVTMTRVRAMKEQLLDRNSSVICRMMECVICLEYMLEEVYSCVAGHLICGHCRMGLRRCPVCKDRLGNTRCLMAETLARGVEFACQTEGCDFVGSLKNLAAHETKCQGLPKTE
ncbi:hypothetical protein JTB14_031719 [Gonioctena quinquepunctata]|nr:hypothetical protein JTB14_031719 [Gonioctena quinquepunctata]